MKHIITFNTGRQYSDKGQRVACARMEDGRVMFADVDRNIDGITQERTSSISDRVLQAFVMQEYDHGRITYGTNPRVPEEGELMQELIKAAKAL